VRFLLINQYYPPDVAPTGQYLHDLARGLVANGHEVHVVCSRRSYGGSARYPPRETREGVFVHRVAALGFGRSGLLARIADYGSFQALLAWTALRLPRPDLVVALTTPPFVGLVAAAVARLRGAGHAHWVMDLYPDVLVAHGLVRPDGWAARLLAACARRQLANARLVVALGPFMAERVAAYRPAGTAVESVLLWADASVMPCADGEPSRLRRERGWADDELVLMYSGNMGLGHRLGEFLEAARRLGPTGPRWAFIGDGARRNEVEAFARAHQEARISLRPYVAAENLRDSLCSADVHLASLSRAWQGLIVPSKIQGIFSVGRPVIFVGPRANEVARWIEESGGGWIVAEGDVDGVMAAVDDAHDAAERARRGAAALAFARDRFARDRACSRLVRLVEAAAG